MIFFSVLLREASPSFRDGIVAYLHKLSIYATKGRCFFGGLAVEMAAISTGGEGGDGRRHNGRRGDVEWLIERGIERRSSHRD